jgi:hypothetical protein
MMMMMMMMMMMITTWWHIVTAAGHWQSRTPDTRSAVAGTFAGLAGGGATDDPAGRWVSQRFSL